MGCLQEN
ncbi:putative middle T antigen, partial [Trichinella spiralis]